MLRNFPLFQFKHGDHICVFYQSEDALMEALTPYIAEGLRNGECCFCVQNSAVTKRLFDDLRFLGLRPEFEVERGALLVHSEKEIYFPNGRFEPERMMQMLEKAIDQCANSGFSGFRSAGDLSWAARGQEDCKQVIGYEKMVEECFPGKAAVGLCQYAVKDFPAEVLESVLAAHRMHLVDDTPSIHSSLSLGLLGHVAEIVADKHVVRPAYYYVVQQSNPREVVGWGIASDFHAAHEQIERLVYADHVN
jgi:hypothetical protein